ncbi:MAG: hypothetical protein II852_18150 [Bacteroidales bacterium]|nr:hypothetical protein [Bacteroidales bacterium]
MKTISKLLLLIAIMLMSNAMASAQIKALLPDSEQLPKELEDFMGVRSSKNEEMKADVKKFIEKLTTRKISDEHRAEIVILMNSYIQKRATPTPHMHNLIRALNGFWDKGNIGEFMPWAEYIQELLNNPQMSMSRINDVSVFVADLLSTNSLENSSSKSWYMTSPNFKMTVETVGGAKDIVVRADNVDIRCKMRQDSTLAIYGTSGSYSFNDHIWRGKGGKVDWRRGNISADSVYATLHDYEIETRSPEFEAKNVEFYNIKYFKKPIKGTYRDKVVLNGVGEKARFPQFSSYDTDIKIPNLAEGIDYVGGYAQNGVIFQGEVQDSAKYAKLIFKYEDKPLITAESKAFVFGLKKLEAQTAIITMQMGPDTGQITHKGVKLRYDSDAEKLILFKGTTGMENAHYRDTYHHFEFDVNQVEWTRNDTAVYLCTRPAAPYDTATFESIDHYSIQRYNQLQGMDKVHPLIALRDFMRVKMSDKFTAREFQKYLNKEEGLVFSEVQVHQMLMKLSYQGFVEYDVNTHGAQIAQKMHDYLGAHSGKKDYDGIMIVSKMKNKNGVNAIINLKTYDMDIFNVQPFNLSPARMVKAKPDSASSVTVHRHLGMEIRGKIQAGLADFYGNDFKFDYDRFRIDIPQCDSMAMLTVNYNEATKRNQIDSVHSVLENVKGVLYLDSINNKSGRKTYDEFPRIITSDTSYVYYDKLISESYSRDKFHMKVTPFKLDSLNFLKLNGVQAKGDFVSGIFDDMDVTLTVQQDLSLGFDIPTPEEGKRIFGGKGRFYQGVALNGKGLGGNGKITYLTATAESDNFIFYPDSVIGTCQTLKIDPVTISQIASTKDVEAEYPVVTSNSCGILWYPHQDNFAIFTSDTALTIFDKKLAFNGNIDYTPKSMKAQGELLYSDAAFFSDKMLFKNSSFDADSAMFCNFDYSTPGDSTGYFYTDRYNATGDLNVERVQFVVSGDSARVHFPHHRYSQRTEFFEWTVAERSYRFGDKLSNYDETRITRSVPEYRKMRRDKSATKALLAGATMISHKDSLRYDALYTTFANKEDVINVHEPGIIKVVDSKIKPSGVIHINRGGDIERFDDAVITANLDTLIHRVVKTSVKLRDKRYFKAIGGQYEYQNYNKDKAYLDLDSMEIRLIKLDTAAKAPKVRVSFGIGSVPEEQNFFISPQFKFDGKYSFNGATPGIKFNGYAIIQQQCDSTIMPFIFEGTINPDSILFPISEKVADQKRRRLYTGFFYDEKNQDLYSIFMGHKHNVSDKEILVVNRGLTYDPKTKEYREATPRRLRDSSYAANYVVFQNNLCNVYGEGTISTNVDMNPVQLVTSGELYHNRDKKQISGAMFMTINFPIRADVIKTMSEELNDVYNLSPVFFNERKIRRRMEYVLGNDTVQALLKNYELSGDLGKMPNGLNKTIVLSDVQMYYDTATLSYRSSGDIGVGFVGGTSVGKYMKGYVEIIRNEKKGDQISIFLQPTPQRWYYFNYKAGFMYCLSSNDDDFNNKIINTKDKDRVTKVDKNEYQFVLGAAENKNKFIRSFNGTVPVDDTDDLQNINSDIESDDNPSGDGNNDADNTTPGDNKPADDDDSDFILEDDPTPMDDSHEQQQQPQQQAQPQQQSDQPAADDEEEQDYIDD